MIEIDEKEMNGYVQKTINKYGGLYMKIHYNTLKNKMGSEDILNAAREAIEEYIEEVYAGASFINVDEVVNGGVEEARKVMREMMSAEWLGYASTPF